MASHLDRRWPQDWNSDGCEPGANWPHTRIFSWPLAVIPAYVCFSENARAAQGSVVEIGGLVRGVFFTGCTRQRAVR